MPISVFPAQIRAGRALLGWSYVELAGAAKVSISTVINAEGRNPGWVRENDKAAILNAMQLAGVTFHTDGIYGVSLKPWPDAMRAEDGTQQARC